MSRFGFGTDITRKRTFGLPSPSELIAQYFTTDYVSDGKEVVNTKGTNALVCSRLCAESDGVTGKIRYPNSVMDRIVPNNGTVSNLEFEIEFAKDYNVVVPNKYLCRNSGIDFGIRTNGVLNNEIDFYAYSVALGGCNSKVQFSRNLLAGDVVKIVFNGGGTPSSPNSTVTGYLNGVLDFSPASINTDRLYNRADNRYFEIFSGTSNPFAFADVKVRIDGVLKFHAPLEGSTYDTVSGTHGTVDGTVDFTSTYEDYVNGVYSDLLIRGWAMGAEELTDRTFQNWTGANNLTNWVESQSIPNSYVEENANGVRMYSDGQYLSIAQTALEVGKYYLLEYEIHSNSGLDFLTVSNPLIPLDCSVGTHSVMFQATTTAFSLKRASATGLDLILKSISVKEAYVPRLADDSGWCRTVSDEFFGLRYGCNMAPVAFLFDDAEMDRSDVTIYNSAARSTTYDSSNPKKWYSEDLAVNNFATWVQTAHENRRYLASDDSGYLKDASGNLILDANGYTQPAPGANLEKFERFSLFSSKRSSYEDVATVKWTEKAQFLLRQFMFVDDLPTTIIVDENFSVSGVTQAASVSIIGISSVGDRTTLASGVVPVNKVFTASVNFPVTDFNPGEDVTLRIVDDNDSTHYTDIPVLLMIEVVGYLAMTGDILVRKNGQYFII